MTALFKQCGYSEAHDGHEDGAGFGTFYCPGVVAEPKPDPVSIPLPPEPPRDRVVEAVDRDGQVVERWSWADEHGCWVAVSGQYQRDSDWEGLVYDAMDCEFLLRHVAAESGET